MFNTLNVSEVGRDDKIYAPSLGTGKVIECTEKPGIRVDFDKVGKRWLTQAGAERLDARKA